MGKFTSRNTLPSFGLICLSLLPKCFNLLAALLSSGSKIRHTFGVVFSIFDTGIIGTPVLLIFGVVFITLGNTGKSRLVLEIMSIFGCKLRQNMCTYISIDNTRL